MGLPGYPDRYKWEYHVYNVSFDEVVVEGNGIAHVAFTTWAADQIIEMGNNKGWSQQIGEAGDETVVKWSYVGAWPGMRPGEDGIFWFTTPPLPIFVGQGDARDPGEANRPAGPALLPDDIQVLITAGNSEGVTEQNGLKVAKWSDAFQAKADKSGVEIKGPNTANDETKNRDFIDRDPDRFNVWVRHRSAQGGRTITAAS